ncbi:multidrug resistance protein fnx1 [Fusarium denticulatum]|uniref:Multidrug resistance protein fnx1 n=1 Tax=Fusarium denticulatum TaxID=48507 RepID=A0A8H5UFT8_9HYPO|nr:multidrug resistance protein fnx1 [Fusarium denticulatum]
MASLSETLPPKLDVKTGQPLISGEGKGGQLPEPGPTSVEDDRTKRSRLQTAVITTSLMSALFLSALDVTIVATAVPTISQDLESQIGYVWIGATYVLSNAACSPTWGKLSDIWGRKIILLITIGIFWLGSLLCGTAISMNMLLGARAIQGIGSGGVSTLVNICIGDLFSVRERGFYYGLVGAVWGISSAIGPVVGGVLASQASWRWCFYINLPLSGVGILALYFTLQLHNPRTTIADGLKAVDWLGSLTVIGSTILLLLGVEFGGVTYPWTSPTIVCLLVVGTVLASLFILIEAKYAAYPIVPLNLFANRSNLGTFVTAFCHTMVSNSGSYWLPLYFQGALATSALLSGVYILPFLMGMCIISAASGFLIRKTGNYVFVISGGMFVATIGFGLLIDLPSEKDFVKIILYQVVAGIGVGPNYQSPLIALQNNVASRDIGSATSTYGFIRSLASAISIVLGGVVFNNMMNCQQTKLRALLGNDLAEKFSGDNASSNVFAVAELEGKESFIVRGAYLTSIRTMYILFVALSGVGILSSFMIKQKRLSLDHKEHKTGLQSL